MKITPSQLTDADTLVAVVSQYDRSIDIWDEGYGPLWVYRETMGIVGVVRARTWEEAYECAQDELMHDFDEADMDAEDIARAEDTGELPDGVSYRSNGVPSNPNRHSSMAQEDLNGSDLSSLTDDLAADLGIRVYVRRDVETFADLTERAARSQAFAARRMAQ